MLLRQISKLCTSVLLAFFAAPAYAQDIVIGTGSKAGVYYPVGGSICRGIHGAANMTCEAAESVGSIDNIYALRLGETDFAMVQSDVHHEAFFGSIDIAHSPYRDLRSVVSLHAEALTIIVRDDGSVKNFEDLRGKHINVGERDSGSRRTFDKVLPSAGMTRQDFYAISDSSDREAGRKLCDGEIDAMMLMIGYPAASVTSLADTCAVNLIALPDSVIDDLARTREYLQRVQIPGGLYADIPQTTATIGTAATLVTMADQPHDAVEAVLAAIFDDFPKFQRQHYALADLQKDKMAHSGLIAPLHPAAKIFFETRGLLQSSAMIKNPRINAASSAQYVPQNLLQSDPD